MPQQTSIRIASELLEALDAHRPTWKTLPRFVEDQLEKVIIGLDSTNTLGDPPTGGAPSFKAVSKKEDVDFSLRAEEAHVEPECLEAVRAPSGLKRHQVARSIDPAYQSLQCHSDLIQEFWRAKSGKRSDRAWVTLLNGLTAIQSNYGDRIVREQLELASASGWSNITLANYEKFGLPRGNAPAQANDSSRFAHLTGMSI